MKRTLLMLLAGFGFGPAIAQTYDHLDINQVKARVNSGGDLHWSVSSGMGAYECPKGSGKNWGGPASIWIGGIDAGNQLRVAAQTYQQSGVDFWTGPLSTVDATTTSSAVAQYNRVWKINKADIDAFIQNYANGNVQNGSYIPVPEILSWPGNGDISQGQDLIMAPFVDTDADGIYNPMGAGDYPLIKGDQAVYTIYNDNYGVHQSSQSVALGIEVRLMAYAYGPCSVVGSHDFLNYTTFYNYKIINRSTTPIYQTRVGLFNDPDIGSYMNDYVGSNVQGHYAYAYNAPGAAANEPAVGVVQLQGPYNTSDGIDNDNDGMIDEANEQMTMTNFMYFNNTFLGIPVSQTDPANGNQFYQYMQSFWKDGVPLTCGGNGYGGTTATPFAYTGSSYTNGACGSGAWTESGTGTDKKFVMSSGPFTYLPGEVLDLEYAFITAFDSIGNNPLAKLDANVNDLWSIYNSTLGQCMTTGLKSNVMNNEFSIWPNPSNGILNIRSAKTQDDIVIQIVDVLGKVYYTNSYQQFDHTAIDLSNMTSGIYFIKLTNKDGSISKKIVKQ